jgi:ketosteroid isomerase-like protein
MANVIDSDELRARDEGWRQCIEARDAEAVVEFLDDDYTLVVLQPERSVTSRDRWLKTLPDYHVHEWRVEDQVIDVDGDLGVIFQRVFMRATVLGTDRSGIFVLTDVWRRRKGRWLVWRRHSAPLSAGAMPVAE